MNAVTKLLVYPRSALFYFGFGFLTVFFSTTGILLTKFLPFSFCSRYFVTGNVCILAWLRITCGVKTKIIGKLPDQGPYVAMAKHQSQWETLHLQWYLAPVTTVAKKELFSVPFFGWALKMMNAIGIDRSNPRAALKQTMELGVARIKEGSSLLIFPEGTRVPPGQRGSYARSGANIAVAAGVPIVPIAHNAGRCWPARSRLLYPGTITLVIGEPISTENGDSRQLTQQVADWIEERCVEIG